MTVQSPVILIKLFKEQWDSLLGVAAGFKIIMVLIDVKVMFKSFRNKRNKAEILRKMQQLKLTKRLPDHVKGIL